MNLDRLIEILCAERGERAPALKEDEKPDYFRALCNVRPPLPASEEFLRLQDEYLSEKTRERGVTDVNDFTYAGGVALFRGDILTLNADAIVNAANSAMLGCFQPLHNCIDNAIHSAAGVQVRLDCNAAMRGGQAENGDVLLTRAYNLPCGFIFHTVGPMVRGRATKRNEADLEKCYVSCLEKADEMKLRSIAFCCVSTGVFGYDKRAAAKVAVRTVKEYLARRKSGVKVIFDVFTEEDYAIYKDVLG